jgi:hypothetical protein
MMFMPWFDVENANGDTTWIAALAPVVVNDDGSMREIVVGSQIIKTRLSAHEVFNRMGRAIEGAHNAELEALMPTAVSAAADADEVPERDTPHPGSA